MNDREPGCTNHDPDEVHEAIVEVLSYVLLGLAAIGLVTVMRWALVVAGIAITIAMWPIGLAMRLVGLIFGLALGIVGAILGFVFSPLGLALVTIAVIIWAVRRRSEGDGDPDGR